jgi:hypothetical protein
MATNVVPAGMTFHQGRRAYREGDTLPADTSDEALASMGLKAASAKTSAAASATASASGSSTK